MVHFVFVPLTTYQIMVSDVYARYICEKELGKVSLICVGMNEKKTKQPYDIISTPYLNGTKLNRIIQRLVYGGRLFFASGLKKVIRKDIPVCLFLFNDNEPVTNKLLREIKTKTDSIAVLMDEGIGSYADTNNINISYKQVFRIMFTSLLGSPMQYKAIGDNPLIDLALVSNKDLYITLEKSNGQKVFRQDVRELYRRTDLFLEEYYKIGKDFLKCDVVYLGQPFYENSDISFEEEKYICHLIDLIPSTLRIIIKPHPRDKIGKYNSLEKKYKNVSVISKELESVPLECIVGFIDAKILVGHNSSALINIANSFSDIQCCLTYAMPCAKTLHSVWEKSFSYSVYSDSMYTSINNNLRIVDSDQSFAMIFENVLDLKNSDNNNYNNEFPQMINYCLGILDERE